MSVCLLTMVVGPPLVLVWLLTWPPTGVPESADAVAVLSGPSARLDRGLELVEADVAPSIVISNGNRPDWPRGNVLCGTPQDFEVICFRPRPQTTAAEARAIVHMADKEGWEQLAVVTSPSHITRSRVLIGQCTDRPVAMVTHDVDLQERLRPASLVREALGLLAGLTVARAC